MSIRLILVSIEGGARQAYLDAIKPFGVQMDMVSSFKELRKLLTKNMYNGVMVDLKTKIMGQREDKELVYEILDQFPLLQLSFEQKTGLIRSFHYGQPVGNKSLETFINNQCRSFKARKLRSSVRKQLHFNVIMSRTGDFSEDYIDRTVTINISKGGCFIYSTDKWKINDRVTFVIKELDDRKPILSEVRWNTEWGKTMQIPGIGVKFENIGEAQLKEICDKGHLL